MTTYYTKTPTLEERMLGAPLIVVGTVVSEREVLDEATEPKRVLKQWVVQVRRVLRGDSATERVTVRFVPRSDVAAREDQEHLLFLTPFRPGLSDEEYVPFMGSQYAVRAGRVQVEDGDKRVGLSLDDVHRRVKELVARQEKGGAAERKMAPGALRSMQTPSEELPGHEGVGGRPASVGGGPKAGATKGQRPRR